MRTQGPDVTKNPIKFGARASLEASFRVRRSARQKSSKAVTASTSTALLGLRPGDLGVEPRLNKLDDDRLVLLHPRSGRYYLTEKGARYVETARLAQP
jgi:hypothetical protein